MKLAAKQIERLVKQGEVVHTECKEAFGGLPDSLWAVAVEVGISDARNSHIFWRAGRDVDGRWLHVDVPH